MFTADKIKKMDDRMTFVLGFRNLYNLIAIFVAAVLIIVGGATVEGRIVGFLVLVLSTKWYYDQTMHNIDDIEIRDLIEKKEG